MSEKLSKTLKDIQFTMIKNKEEQKVLTHTQLDFLMIWVINLLLK